MTEKGGKYDNSPNNFSSSRMQIVPRNEGGESSQPVKMTEAEMRLFPLIPDQN